MASSVWNRHRGRVTHCVEGSPLPAHPIALLWLARVGYHSSVVRRAGPCHTRSMRAKSRKTAGQCAWRLELIGHLRLPCHPSVNKHPVIQLARCEYVDRRENVVAIGNSRTGMTHVALTS